MSAIGGIYSFGTGVVDIQMLAALGAGLSARGCDRGREISKGSIGMSYRAFHINRESRLEVQPYVAYEGHILVLDGRLDNREELIRLTGLRCDAGSRCLTDVEIVMTAYLKWGEGFVSRLVGEFALSLWDSVSRRLLLARDPVGVRSLFYKADATRVMWSTDLTALLDVFPAEELQIDEDHVAGYLSRAKDPGRTPFKGFYNVRPGYVITVDHLGCVSERRFWGLDPDAEIRFSSDAEYEERFLELFEEAVGSRLRAESTVMAELSGGLDSSSIVCMADRLIKRGCVEAPRLEMVSHVSDECATADERQFIHSVEEHVGRQSNYIRQEEFPFLTPMSDTSRISTINPSLTNAGYLNALKVLMGAKGSRIRLSGVGGDELLHSVNDPSPELCELLVGWRFLRLWRRVKVWGKLLREPYGRLLWRKALLPSLPLHVQATFKNGVRGLSVPIWMNSDFVARTHLRERYVSVQDIYGFRRPTGRDQSVGFLSVANVIAQGHLAEACEHEVSYPYLHLPLVEFLCAIPFDQLLRPGQSRFLMRRALAGVLPEKILRRKGKGSPREIVGVAFERQWPKWRELFDEPLVARYGFVELMPLRAAIDRVRHGLVDEARPLVSIMTLEVWLRIIEKRKREPPQGLMRASGVDRTAVAV